MPIFICSPTGELERYFESNGITVHIELSSKITDSRYSNGVLIYDELKDSQENNGAIKNVFMHEIGHSLNIIDRNSEGEEIYCYDHFVACPCQCLLNFIIVIIIGIKSTYLARKE